MVAAKWAHARYPGPIEDNGREILNIYQSFMLIPQSGSSSLQDLQVPARNAVDLALPLTVLAVVKFWTFDGLYRRSKLFVYRHSRRSWIAGSTVSPHRGGQDFPSYLETQ